LSSRSKAWIWLGVFSALGVAIVLLYPDSYQQDGGHHYLFARNAWAHPRMFVGVWSRPLFTFIYSFPALLGYDAARLFTVLLCALTGYLTFKTAEDAGLERPAAVIPLLFLQPSFFLLSADTMTEPIFALVFIAALRLHLSGRIAAGMLVASTMILARPEGFFLGILWGLWVLFDPRAKTNFWSRLPSTLLLATGSGIWWLAALLITGDPLFITNNWPRDWGVTQATYGTGSAFTYIFRMPEIAGPILCLPLLIGLGTLVAKRKLGGAVSAFLTIFAVHSLLRTFGFFGAAGYPRYFVCVAPAIALITVDGWNEMGRVARSLSLIFARGLAVIVLVVSFAFTISYLDAMYYIRDARAVAEMYAWFQANARPVQRVVWSQAYMCILFDCDIAEKPPFGADKEFNLNILRRAPSGTLVFWDGDTGPSWYRMKADDIEAAGFTRLRSQSYRLDGLLLRHWWFRDWGARRQEMHLLYKP